MKNTNRRRWKQIMILMLMGILTYACKNPQTANQQSAEGETLSSSRNEKTITLKIPNHPLENPVDLDVLLAAIGDARVVLLGEASHGTSEYYTWRAAISKRLIEEKGFDFIAVEGEWADSYRVNKFIKGEQQDSAAVVELLYQYNRWPTWMWGNYEVASLVHWPNTYNQGKAAEAKVGFYGLDVYCLWESMSELMPYLQNVDPSLQKVAKKVHKCFQPYSADAQLYAQAVAEASASCRTEAQRLWKAINKLNEKRGQITEEDFVAEQNALVARNGERYYRTMVSNSEESWNIRDHHMTETLSRLLSFHGADSKVIVWEHNTHVGDARYTDMAKSGMVNVGQLVRKEWGAENVFIVGFGSYSGSVIASEAWAAPMKKMDMPEAVEGSWEQILHQLGSANKLILSKELKEDKHFKRPIGHRAIGVVYHPQTDMLYNYVPSIIPSRYDAFIFIDKTKALHPLGVPPTGNEPPDLYPWGF